MKQKVIFEELNSNEKCLLLRAFDFDVDSKGVVLDQTGRRIPSEETAGGFVTIENCMLTPGSLKVAEASPISISKFIRERVENTDECHS
jgi:hypothetical protein